MMRGVYVFENLIVLRGPVSGGGGECRQRLPRTHPWLRLRIKDSDLNRHHDQDSHSLPTLQIARFHSGLP
ncbi:hypothetical protein E2C01_039717 [Portunus trituberculatus]|uniref:Uncharacterized protein n=1 Tax=Portunus trituberculatus TaxID=210409 RepID=A0A5B7FEI0_PORTR|nr:hypothetical protein [Portunus trituberculatus]